MPSRGEQPQIDTPDNDLAQIIDAFGGSPALPRGGIRRRRMLPIMDCSRRMYRKAGDSEGMLMSRGKRRNRTQRMSAESHNGHARADAAPLPVPGPADQLQAMSDSIRQNTRWIKIGSVAGILWAILTGGSDVINNVVSSRSTMRNSSPNLSFMPVGMWLGAGADLNESSERHEVTLMIPGVISNRGGFPLSPYEYTLIVESPKGRFKLPSVLPPPKVDLQELKEGAGLKDIFSGLVDFAGKVDPLAAGAWRSGFLCFRSDSVAFEDIDSLPTLKGRLVCKDMAGEEHETPFVLTNVNQSGESRIRNLSFAVSESPTKPSWPSASRVTVVGPRHAIAFIFVYQ